MHKADLADNSTGDNRDINHAQWGSTPVGPQRDERGLLDVAGSSLHGLHLEWNRGRITSTLCIALNDGKVN